MNDYNYYNNDSVAVLMDNMFKCKNEIHVVKPLLKLLHDNNAIPRANYKGINDGLQGFDTDLNEENKLYNNLIKNVQFRPNVNNEKNLVKLLADVYRKFDLSEEVLQSVILSWLVTNKEYNSSCNLINDANKLHNIMMEYSQKKHGRVMVKHGGFDREERVRMMIEYFYNLFEIDGTTNVGFKRLYYKLKDNLNPLNYVKPAANFGAQAVKDVGNLGMQAVKNVGKLGYNAAEGLGNFAIDGAKVVLEGVNDINVGLKNIFKKGGNEDEETIIKLMIENFPDFKILKELNEIKSKEQLITLITNDPIYYNYLTKLYNDYRSNEHKDFSEHWDHVQKIVESLKRLPNTDFSLIVKGGNNNSHVNKAIVNNMLIGGGEFLLQLSTIDFNDVSKKFIAHLKQRGYEVENNDIVKLENLAKVINEKLNEYRLTLAEYYVTKYLKDKMKNNIEIGKVNYDITKLKLKENIINNHNDMKNLNNNLKDFFKFYNIYSKTINSGLSNVNKDHTDFGNLYNKYII